MIGVTGTQGKTTTTRLAASGLEEAGVRAAVIGTVGTRVAGEDVKTALTTPEAPDLHGLFAMMRERDVAVCAMEVSSHALVMGRVDGVVFDVAVFLNLGRDHLDFHRDVDDYFDAKASLFTPERARVGLTNVDDEHGRLLLDRATVPMRTFSITGTDADWRASEVELTAEGSTFVITTPAGDRITAGCPLPGDFNVSNTLAAVAAAGE
ncbi:Mur ligase family protein, partial [Nocardioides hankookensis]